ncbi:YceI family protein [Robiginitalea sp.]|nr:YceI family protein [Robiginitalea sp.]
MKNYLFLGGFLLLSLAGWSQHNQTWALQKPSSISYTAIHPLHKWTGTSTSVQAIMTTSNDEPEKLAIMASVRSFDSQNSNRDAHALEVLDALKFPQVKFSSTEITKATKGYTVTGTLEFHGLKKNRSIPVQFHKTESGWHLSGSFEVSLTEHEIDPPSFMLVKTEDLIKIEVDLTFEPKA